MSVRVTPLISSLTGFDSIISNGETISRAPKLSFNNFVSHSVLRSGQSMIVGGLVTQTNDVTHHRLPNKHLPEFLSNHSGMSAENELIVIVSAQEIEA